MCAMPFECMHIFTIYYSVLKLLNVCWSSLSNLFLEIMQVKINIYKCKKKKSIPPESP